MTTTHNNQLTNPSEIEKKIISPRAIDYLAGKVKEHNIGIKLERKQNGIYESLSIWDKGNETVKEWKKLDISTAQIKQTTIDSNQEKFSEMQGKVETENTVDAN